MTPLVIVFYDRSMLVGREPEQQRIATLVAGARVRQSGVLVISGEAGIGKTALLEDSARAADEMTVLRASGSEFEAGLGFSGLHQLLLPAPGLLDHLPPQLREALEVALTLRSGPAPERFAVGVATLSLLSRSAEDRPLLLLIDDAHLLDPATAETVRFVARRLVADPIALLVFLRPEPDAILNTADLPRLELTGVGVDAAKALIAKGHGGRQDPRMRWPCIARPRATRLRYWSFRRISTAWPGCRPNCPSPVPDAIARAFGGRVSSLTESARHALLIAAIADGDLVTTAQAAAATGVHRRRTGGGRGDRSAALWSATAPCSDTRWYARPSIRPRRPACAATCTAPWPAHCRSPRPTCGPGTSAKPASARTMTSPTRLAAVADRRTRARSPRRSGYRVRRGPPNSRHSMGCGRPGCSAPGSRRGSPGSRRRADALLEKATVLATDRATLAEIDDLRGNLALLSGSLDEGREMLLRAAELSESSDPDAAVMRLADVISGCFYQCNTAGALAAADRVERLDRHLQHRRRAHPRSDGDRGSTRACRRPGRAMDSHRGR